MVKVELSVDDQIKFIVLYTNHVVLLSSSKGI